MMGKKADIVWWEYEYDCATSECLKHGTLTAADNCGNGKGHACPKCDAPVDLRFVKKYRSESRVITPAVIEYQQTLVKD